jgi:small subunit ribosomal protein S3
MGQKASPKTIRLKISENWKSLWFNDKKYGDQIIEDLKIKRKLSSDLKTAFLSDITIDRDANTLTVNIMSSRPGVIIGRGGSGSDKIKSAVEKLTSSKVRVNIFEVKKPDLDAAIVAQSVAMQLEKRMPFRRAIKQAMEKARDAGARGVKIQVAGRLNGADIARREKVQFGTLPLSTFKEIISFGRADALTTYGIIGVKVWIYIGNTKVH